MTRHYSVTIDGPAVTLIAHRNMETAAETELARASQGYESHAFGSINGEAYLIVYFKGAHK